jgi:PST family polysaccharide transporter
MHSIIKDKVAIGAGWMIALRWVNRLIGFISIAILARLLLPEDFGVVAYATVFLMILEQMTQFDFKTVLVRDLQATDEKYDTVWTLEIIKGLILAAVLVAAAIPAAAYFNEPKVETVLYVIALVPLIRGFTNVGIVDFQKRLELRKSFYFDSTARLIGVITAVTFAVTLRNHWALVYASVVEAITRVVLSYVMSDFRPKLLLSNTANTLRFSLWLLVQNIMAAIQHRVPALVVGRVFGTQELAFFRMGSEITDMATSELAVPIRHALFPGIVQMQESRSQMDGALISALGIIIMIGLPAAVGTGVTAPLLAPAILGENWVDVAPIIAVFSVYAAVNLFYPNSNVFYLTINKPQIIAHITFLNVCLLIPAIWFAIPDHGALGVVWAIVAVSFVTMAINYAVLIKMTSITLKRIVSAVWRSTLAAVIMAFGVDYIVDNPPNVTFQNNVFLHLVLSIASGVISYVSILAALWWLSGTPQGPEAYVIRTLKRILNRLPIFKI